VKLPLAAAADSDSTDEAAASSKPSASGARIIIVLRENLIDQNFIWSVRMLHFCQSNLPSATFDASTDREIQRRSRANESVHRFRKPSDRLTPAMGTRQNPSAPAAKRSGACKDRPTLDPQARCSNTEPKKGAIELLFTL
jgi:hypothetical protein